MGRTFRSLRGLRYIPNYLSNIEQDELLQSINTQPWLVDLKRRVQHYGYRYDYRRSQIDTQTYLGQLPVWLTPLAERVHRDGLIDQVPDQVIINEYEPGQGIAAHVDSLKSFGGSVLSVSLGSPCVMIFAHPSTKEQVPLLLEPGSLLVMQGEARSLWKHGIPARKQDVYQGQIIRRERRISATFRKVLADPPPVAAEYDDYEWQPTIA
jgi:alkylated DNA repair dioxygenase AlkB